jgi:hypothetical protein
MRRLINGVLVLCLLCPACVKTDGANKQPVGNVILIGWDGAGRPQVKECLDRGRLPNLKRLTEEGKMVDMDIYGKTDTKAGWTEILTGYGPEKTGVYNNAVFEPIPEGYTVFERLKKHFGKDFVTAAVIGKKIHCGECDPPRKITAAELRKNNAAGGHSKRFQGKLRGEELPPGGEVVIEDGVEHVVVPGSPYLHAARNTDVWEYGLMDDKKVGARAIELLEKNKDKRFFFFIHFAEVDHNGHWHGENSQQYVKALVSNDEWTGRIIDKLRELGLYDKTTVYVTADHGFNENTNHHGCAPYVWLATNDRSVCRNGRRDDIAPTILSKFALDLGRFAPALDGRPLTQKDDRPAPTEPPGQPRVKNPHATTRPAGSSAPPIPASHAIPPAAERYTLRYPQGTTP